MSEPRVPSPAEVAAAMTVQGGWTKKTLEGWGITWPPSKGWRRDLAARWKAEQGLGAERHPRDVAGCPPAQWSWTDLMTPG